MPLPQSEPTAMLDPLQEVESRLKDLESWKESLQIEQLLNHSGLAVVAGEGIRGGGTLDASRSLGLALGELEVAVPRLSTESIPFWDDTQGQHFTVPLKDLIEVFKKLSNFPQELDDLRQEIKGLWKKVSLFTLYERLYMAETEVKKMREELDEEKSRKEGRDESEVSSSEEGSAGSLPGGRL